MLYYSLQVMLLSLLETIQFLLTAFIKTQRMLEKMIKQCAWCQKDFWTEKSKTLYCGQKCFAEKRTKKENYTCIDCGGYKPGWKTPRCRACYAKSRQIRIAMNCAHCGKEKIMYPSKIAETSRTYGVFCNKECFGAFYRGEKNKAYIDGSRMSPYPSAFHSKKKKALQRENGHCYLCGQKPNKALDVHHIDRNTHNNEIWNLVALCRPCHNKQKGKTEQETLNLANVMLKKLQEQFGYQKRFITSEWQTITTTSAITS